jgi:hypothetical protein
MRHLRSLALCVAALACFVPAQALASSARIDGLGLQSDYVQDYVNVIHYPSTIVRYQNLVYGDLGIKDLDTGDLSDFEDNSADVPALNESARSMGAFLKLWKSMPGVFGVQLNENAGPVSSAYGAEFWNRNRNESFNLLWGNDFGSVSAGFQFNRSSSGFESGTTDNDPSPFSFPSLVSSGSNTRERMNRVNASLGAEPRNAMGVGGGLTFGWDSYGRHHTADIAVQYRSLSLEQSSGAPGATVTVEDDGGMALAINGRSQFATSDNTYLTPVVNYWTLDMSAERLDQAVPATNFNYENTVTGWNVGLAESWVMREQDLLTLGFAFGNESVEYADPTRSGNPFDITYSTTPQLFGAVEIHPTNWFHVRLGASKSLASKFEIEDTSVGGVTQEWTDSPFGYTVGTGFRIGGRLDIDAVMNQDFGFTGGWIASGNEETPFSRLSATYRF